MTGRSCRRHGGNNSHSVPQVSTDRLAVAAFLRLEPGDGFPVTQRDRVLPGPYVLPEIRYKASEVTRVQSLLGNLPVIAAMTIAERAPPRLAHSMSARNTTSAEGTPAGDRFRHRTRPVHSLAAKSDQMCQSCAREDLAPSGGVAHRAGDRMAVHKQHRARNLQRPGLRRAASRAGN